MPENILWLFSVPQGDTHQTAPKRVKENKTKKKLQDLNLGKAS